MCRMKTLLELGLLKMGNFESFFLNVLKVSWAFSLHVQATSFFNNA
jgi:hypothetical protein